MRKGLTPDDLGDLLELPRVAVLATYRPDGTVLSYQPYGKEGVLITDIDLTAATGLLASRCKAY